MCRAMWFGAAMLGTTAALMLNAGAAGFDDPSKAPSPAAPNPAAQTQPPAAETAREAMSRAISGRLSSEARAKGLAMIAKAEEYLRSRQDKSTGGWSMPKPDKDGKTPPQFPGVSALVLTGMLMDPKADPSKDAALAAGIKYLLNLQQPDGGIYDKMLPSYNTALSVSALSQVKDPRASEAVRKAVEFLRKLQWGEASDPSAGGNEAARPVPRDHPFYGGVGYGRSGRPDASNLNMFMQALHDAGISPEDDAVKRALVFIERTQMDDRVNDMPYAKGSRQGGMIYSTVDKAESVDSRPGQSQAGSFEETLSDGTKASRLRAYGSMTYAGFKSYVYARLKRDDPRVVAAYDWIRRNYSVDENPGMGSEGQYYYYVVFARALKEWGDPNIQLLNEKNEPTGKSRNWREDLINKLAALQNPDGSFKSVSDRWMENNPDLITAYALVALRAAVE